VRYPSSTCARVNEVGLPARDDADRRIVAAPAAFAAVLLSPGAPPPPPSPPRVIPVRPTPGTAPLGTARADDYAASASAQSVPSARARPATKSFVPVPDTGPPRPVPSRIPLRGAPITRNAPPAATPSPVHESGSRTRACSNPAPEPGPTRHPNRTRHRPRHRVSPTHDRHARRTRGSRTTHHGFRHQASPPPPSRTSGTPAHIHHTGHKQHTGPEAVPQQSSGSGDEVRRYGAAGPPAGCRAAGPRQRPAERHPAARAPRSL
jgi:hypothetical protein